MVRKIISLIFLLQISLYAFENVIVVNKQADIDKLTKREIKDIFLMKKHFIKGVKIIPINSATSLSIRSQFEKKVLGLNRHKLNQYWVKQHFQGVRPPVVQSSIQAIKLFVKNVNGAIGYIPKNSLNSDLKVLYEF